MRKFTIDSNLADIALADDRAARFEAIRDAFDPAMKYEYPRVKVTLTDKDYLAEFVGDDKAILHQRTHLLKNRIQQLEAKQLEESSAAQKKKEFMISLLG